MYAFRIDIFSIQSDIPHKIPTKNTGMMMQIILSLAHSRCNNYVKRESATLYRYNGKWEQSLRVKV